MVSSDHRLHRAARRRKAQAIDSDQWYAQTIAARNERRQTRPKVRKPPTPLARSEVEYWLAQFDDEPGETPPTARRTDRGEDAGEKTLGPGEEIFPQEYLDSIDEKELE